MIARPPMTNVKKYRDLGRMPPDKLYPGTQDPNMYCIFHAVFNANALYLSRRFSTFPDKLPPRSAIMDRIDSGRMRYRRWDKWAEIERASFTDTWLQQTFQQTFQQALKLDVAEGYTK